MKYNLHLVFYYFSEVQWNLYPSFLKGPQKINSECRKMIVAGMLFIWAICKEERK
jgi:hypothetical protein